eukprot:NODE_587_length_724_cov_312.931323_g578_i0.p1 GENE.NODE_587_length_724_cov_312.931323_g578_i0~~NODE_587_length_724_cov_312.931323_g578_i0.p1  ORF type:complete len:207 (-),score=89.62 NODE_587_length_724_cov_312.931323_g578_i0:6-626(-)
MGKFGIVNVSGEEKKFQSTPPTLCGASELASTETFNNVQKAEFWAQSKTELQKAEYYQQREETARARARRTTEIAAGVDEKLQANDTAICESLTASWDEMMTTAKQWTDVYDNIPTLPTNRKYATEQVTKLAAVCNRNIAAAKAQREEMRKKRAEEKRRREEEEERERKRKEEEERKRKEEEERKRKEAEERERKKKKKKKKKTDT